MRVLRVIDSAMSGGDPWQPDDCKLSVLLRFPINSTPIMHFGILASGEASDDYAALGI